MWCRSFSFLINLVELATLLVCLVLGPPVLLKTVRPGSRSTIEGLLDAFWSWALNVITHAALSRSMAMLQMMMWDRSCHMQGRVLETVLPSSSMQATFPFLPLMWPPLPAQKSGSRWASCFWPVMFVGTLPVGGLSCMGFVVISHVNHIMSM